MARGESGFNERAIGDNGTAEGVFQLHSARRKAVEKQFKKHLSSMSLLEQVDAYDWELRSSEKAAGNTLFSAKTLSQAVKGGLDSERPGEYQAHGVSGSEYARRYGMAQKALRNAESIGNKKDAPPSPKSSQDNMIRSMRDTRTAVSRTTNNISHSNTNTNFHIQNVNVKADNASQMVGGLKQAAGIPNAHAVAANTGVH